LKPTFYILFLIVIGLFSSCSETIERPTLNLDIETVVIAELEVGAAVENIFISTTYSSEEEPSYPNALQGEVRISNLSPEGQKDVTLRDFKSEHRWFNYDFQFGEGDKLTLTTDFNELGLEPIFATTTAPVSGSIVDKSDANSSTSEDDELVYSLGIELSELEPGNFYHLVPYITNHPDHTNVTVDNINLEASESSPSQADIFSLVHKGGILIDNSTADDRSLDLRLSTKNIPSYSPSHVYLLLKTVTEDYYEYHKTLTLQQLSPQSPLSPSVPSYTNVERGQGIFVAYTTQIDSVLIK